MPILHCALFMCSFKIYIKYVKYFKGFTGKDCDRAIVPCDENPCQNGAVCLLEDEHPVCYCVPDYHGALCELKYDDCESKFARCDNGGTCVDGINNFTCSCPPNFGGPMCEYSFLSTTSTVVVEVVADTRSEVETSPGTTSSASSSEASSTSVVDTSVSSTSTTYSTTPRTGSSHYTQRHTFPDKTTTTSGYEDGSSTSVSSDVSVFLTEVPSTRSATVRDTQDVLVTSESVTLPSVTTESHVRTTETGSTEAYLPTGRSIRDDDVTKEASDRTTKTYSPYDQTTKTYSPASDRTYENVTHVTEYTMSFR